MSWFGKSVNLGPSWAQVLSGRAGGKVADTTALEAVPPEQRVDGMIAVVHPAQIWVFDAASSASASAVVLVPDEGTGRWLAGAFASL